MSGVAARGRQLAIHGLLERQGFGPAETKLLVEAYELALKELDLKDRCDPLTEVVAKLIIKVFQTGERDPRDICKYALVLLMDPDLKA